MSQSDKTLLPPAETITIDGNLKDWSDSLRYFNEEKKWNYTIANDAKFVYLAIRFNDRTEQQRVLMAGLTWGINVKGKKKAAYTLTFPSRDPESGPPAMPAGEQASQPGEQPNEDTREEQHKAYLTKLQKIKVTGFKEIDYDYLSIQNTYGFRAALDYDADGNMVYEAAIPVKFFDAADIVKGVWAFNIKINGFTRPSNGEGGPGGGGRGGMRGGGMGGGGGRGGMGGGGGRGGGMGGGGGRPGRGGAGEGGAIDRTALSKSEDFWSKYQLYQPKSN
ncbi:hypothetical protein GCM10023149_04950 [Mucilaginibacter gynuensis]|uniref:YD repeat-containing protein n=1 Tax=Mucilaginibacter gynuensis TaxID=1302236 RepID=A0ABP8FSS7_9SPHI